MKIKKGDKVIVITGKDKGKTGEVTKVLVQENKVIVSGINIAKRHTKPSQESAGGIISKEMPIHISNVAYVDPKTNKATRLGIKMDKDGRKVRVAKKSGEVVDK
ncbi:MAG: 50S ribosomal protein L24 [Alphaproteobacteria bacterium]|nr:50S ribosomal protein L24 [Alphaproteobacteria bacterium]